MRAPDPLLDLRLPGKMIGRYRVVQKLGEGGMGEVYLAEDTELGRRVALKILKTSFHNNWARLQRFKREAKAVAALSHPGIVTLYSDECVDDVHFLTMEYVPGKGLNKSIPKKGMKLERLFDIAVQLTDALSHAHDAGITHRDLKPSNIMLHKDGSLRILDFGLAKLKEQDPLEADSGASTELVTREGDLLGTVPYMAPEQVQGQPVDERTDIFACGVILYEMATGQRPFQGDSAADLMSSIIRDDPPSVETQKQDTPHHLSRIIKRALEKDPEHRYQSAKDLRNSLDDLRLELESRDGSTTPQRSNHKGMMRAAVIAFAVALAVVSGTVTWQRIVAPEPEPQQDDLPPPPEARPYQVTTSPGWESDVVISPDGQHLAFASNESGNSDIWLVDAVGGTPIQLTRSPADDRKPAWFPDGSAIAFQSDRSGETSIWKVPRLGGSKTMVVRNARQPAVSHDGTRIAFARAKSGADPTIWVASLSDPRRSQELTGPGDGLWGHRDPSWSPDDAEICYSDFGNLWTVSLPDGEPHQLTTHTATDRHPTWSPDGRFIYFTSYREGTIAVWRIEESTGATQRLTMGSGPESRPTISTDGTRLAYTTLEEDPDIFLRDLSTGDEARLPTSKSDWGPTIAPDRSAVAYISNQLGQYSLWIQNLEGIHAHGPPIRLNDEDADSSNLDFSPDGAWLAYQRRVGQDRNIWVIPTTGGLPIPVTQGEGVRVQPTWSPDSSEIAYVDHSDNRAELWIAPVHASSRSPWRIEADASDLMWPDWSPDGRWIAHIGSEGDDREVWLARADNAEPARRLTTGANADYLRWEATTGGLLVSGRWNDGVLAVRRVDPETGTSVPIEPPIDFGSAIDGDFDISLDGKLLTFTRESLRGDVWLLEARSGGY